MFFHKDYRKPFWHGLRHAVLAAFYSVFIALVVFSTDNVLASSAPFGRFLVRTFLAVISIGILGYLLFYEALVHDLKHDFKKAAVMLWSTLGWLFIFIMLFLIGFIQYLS